MTVDNIADTVFADDFRTVEEICTGDVARPTAAGERLRTDRQAAGTPRGALPAVRARTEA